MMFSRSLGLIALAYLTSAFPTEMWEAMDENAELRERAAEIMERQLRKTHKVFEPVPMFIESEQFINVGPGSGHEWVAPGPTDLRGPCPGLNAFANHGFLPHNGYATIQQFIDATEGVVGMGSGLASFLAVYGAVIDGDLTAWSIGGPPPLDLVPEGTLERGRGISESHNKYESDASPMRPDLYQFGNDYKLRIKQFQELSDLQPDKSNTNYNIPVLTQFRAQRFAKQKRQNPFFFNGPFTGVLVQPAAYTFIFRFMANHSKTHPIGYLSEDVLKSWFSVTGTTGNYKWTPGYERIPDKWYKRANAYPYDQTYFFADLGAAGKLHPEFFDVGGNTGKRNSFVGVDIANISGGVFNSGNIGKGNNFACLGYQFAANAKPDVALNSLDSLLAVIQPLQAAIGCPPLENIDDRQFQDYPGYTRSPANG